MNEQVNILCVDDEENVLKALRRVFLDDDYEIHTANSGDAGLEILRNTAPVQIVMSDYRMPKMNGVDFLKEVYRHWPDTVRIVLSGYADTASIVEAINEGHIYKFIPKPWNDAELKVTISNALDTYFIKQRNMGLTKELDSKNRELQKINDKLEDIVNRRTVDLLMQIEMYECSQKILDSLPVAVIGIDPDGEIVQCNKMSKELIGNGDGCVIGTDRRESLPENINVFVDEITKEGIFSAHLNSNGTGLHIKGTHMKYSTGQEGYILVLDKDEEKQ